MEPILSMALLITLHNLIATHESSASAKSLASTHNCSESEYFDINHLRCESCIASYANENDDSRHNTKGESDTNRTKLLTQSADGLSCVCRAGYRKHFTKSTNGKIVCVACDPNQVSIDNIYCADCGENSTPNNDNSSCLCPVGHRLVEEIGNQSLRLKCDKCPDYLMASADGLSCRPCHESYARASGRCECPEKTHTQLDGTCLPKKLVIANERSLYLVEYETSGKQIISDYYETHLRAAVHNCKYERNQSACQLLANLCVLIHYAHYDDQVSQANACNELLKISMPFRANFWLDFAPKIYYKSEYKIELEKTAINNRYKIGEKLEFVAAMYWLNGSLVSFTDLNAGRLQICDQNDRYSESSFVFGTNYRQSCRLSIRHLLNGVRDTNVFFDLYLKSSAGGETSLYPIPVLNTNLKRNNRYVNRYFDENRFSKDQDWILTKRLFLVDTISGVERKSKEESGVDNLERVALRYAKSIDIAIKLRKQDGSGLIYPPIVTIEFGDIWLKDYGENDEVEASFSVSYTMDSWETRRDLSIALGVLSCLAILWSMFRTWCWRKRSGSVAIDSHTVLQFLIICSANIAIVLFFAHICFAVNMFITFKNQSVIHTLLLTSDQHFSFVFCILLALMLKLVHLASELVTIATVDIFFIDWERPKTRNTGVSFTLIKPKSSTGEDHETSGAFKQSELNSETSNSAKVLSEKSVDFPSVTVWRSYFVANEWAELMANRRLSLSVHIMLVILLLDWFGFAQLSTADTKNQLSRDDSQRYVETNMLCRMAIGSLVFGSLALLNVILKRFVYENFIRDPLIEFVDLCSVCNISVFCMTSKRFGYYIHGLSANGMSDVNMKEMYELLKREEDDLCSKRGLLPNSDQQTFEMSLPVAVFAHYQRLRSNLIGFSQKSARTRFFRGSRGLSSVDAEKIVSTNLLVNRFLSGFIEHTFKDVDYLVRDKSSLETILDVEFMDVNERGIFYNDSGHSFESAVYYGLEATLMTFELMFFISVDMLAQSFTFAAISTFIMSKMINRIYLNFARKNLIRKSLIDERFLI